MCYNSYIGVNLGPLCLRTEGDYMQEQEQHQHEIGFSDLFKMIFGKLHVILLAIIVAATLGVALAYAKNHDVYVYGGTAKFKIAVLSTTIDKDGNESTASQNYIYKEEHLSMIVDELSSDVFIRDNILPAIDDGPTDDPKNETFLAKIAYLKSCISYSYNYANNPNSISVSVTVSGDKDFANKLLDQVKIAIPSYIEANMIRPESSLMVDQSGQTIMSTSYTTTCEELTISTARLLNGGQTSAAMTKNAVLFGFIAACVACVAIIIIDSSDTRLRNHERLSDEIDVPVLGVIPKIEHDHEKAAEVQK